MFMRSVMVKGKKYYRIVENHRVNGKVKQAYVYGCGPEERGLENAKYFLEDGDPYKQALESVKDDPRIKRLVRKLAPSLNHKWENRRQGQRDNSYEGRAKKVHCPKTDEITLHRVLKESGKEFCLDVRHSRDCKTCEWNPD